MKFNIKKFEIALFVCNLLLFIVINIFCTRAFHTAAVILMAIPLLIEILINVKKEYVKWKKKAPSILPVLVLCSICVLCEIINKISSVTEYLYAAVFLIEFLCAFLALIAFVRYLITYNRAYKAHRKELGLSKQQRLINSSIPVVLILEILLVWIITISFADRVAAVTSPKKYEKEIRGTEYLYFPTSIPEDAKNEKFYRSPGFWLASDKAYVEFEASKEYLDEYESVYATNVTKVTEDNPWVTRCDSCRVCTYLEEHYLNQGKCDVYTKEDGFIVQGYAINRVTNEIFIFYVGSD